LEATLAELQKINDQIDELQTPAPVVPTSTSKILIQDIWKQFLVSPNRPDSGKKTMEMYHHLINCFTRWVKNNHPRIKYLKDFDRPTATIYAQYLQIRYSGNTFNRHIATLKLMYSCLMEDLNTPFSFIHRKRNDVTKHKPLTWEQFQSILDVTTDDNYRLLFLICAYTALRKGDACNLRYDNFNLANKTLTITPHKTASRSGKTVHMPLHPVLHQALQERYSKRVPTGTDDDNYAIPYMRYWYLKDATHIGKKIQKIFKKAGITTVEQVYKNENTKRNNKVVYNLHSFRFLMGTSLRDRGYNLSVIQNVLCHTSPAMSAYYSTPSAQTVSNAILSLPDVTTKATA
jgi:integrase